MEKEYKDIHSFKNLKNFFSWCLSISTRIVSEGLISVSSFDLELLDTLMKVMSDDDSDSTYTAVSIQGAGVTRIFPSDSGEFEIIVYEWDKI